MAHRNFQENETTKRYETIIPKLKLLAPALGLALLGVLASAQAADKKPNIVVIMGDDIGWLHQTSKVVRLLKRDVSGKKVCATPIWPLRSF
jgi:hypothetical protein